MEDCMGTEAPQIIIIIIITIITVN